MPLPPNPATDFAMYARARMLVRGIDDAERIARTPGISDRVARLLSKGAVGAGSLAEATDYNILVSGFSASLRTKAVFFRLWDDNAFVRAPPRTRLGLITSGALGAEVPEGASVPISKIVLQTGLVLEPRKAAALVVLTRELAENIGADGQSLFSKELQNATASATDAAFLAAVLGTDTGDIISSSGTTPTDAANDLRAALLNIDLHADSKLYWVRSPSVAAKTSTLATQGAYVMGAMSPLGGELLNLPFLTSDAVADDELHLIDGSQIAANLDTIELRSSREADVLMMDGAPPMNSTDPVAAQMTSLFQSNSVGLLSVVYFASERLRPNSTATITGVDWGA